jgi:drug/metabolite transporter (DMT)-like permease
MWILFALTSAIILATRKIQEKELVSIFGQSLGWMIRTGSAIMVILLWIVFSRDSSWVESWELWAIIAIIAVVMYPLQTYTYYRSILDMPLSVFGLLSPVVLLSSILFAYLWFWTIPSILWVIGIILVSLWIVLLVPQKNIKTGTHISMATFAIAILSYSLMGIWWVMDKIAMMHTSPLFYAMLNQGFSAISIIIISKLLYKDMKLDQWVRKIIPVLTLGFISGIAWFLGVYAIQISPNIGYAVAMINTHAIITTLYGIFILKEEVTKRKVFVFTCMVLALVAFAFA